MPDPLEEQLGFDIAPALTAIEQLDQALNQVVQSFSVNLTEALNTALATQISIGDNVDTSALSGAVDAAVSGISAPVALEGDATGLDTAIADALDAPRPPLLIDGDVSEAQTAINQLEGEHVTIGLDADTTDAQAAISDLGSEATGAVGSGGGSAGGHGGGEGVAGLEGAVLGLKASSGLAKGEVGELAGGIGEVGGAGTKAAIGGGAAFLAFVGETIHLAADAQAQNRRFEQTFGTLAEAVRHINVGGLNLSLEELGKQSGTANANLEASASRIGLMGKSSGLAGPQVADITDKLLALGGVISVNNPRLGDAASVTDRVSTAFIRGGRALAPYGISLSAAQISAEALKETHKSATTELTVFDKIVAGTNLAVAQYGDTLGTKFASGAENAQVQLRALKVQLEETLVAIGTPLLKPAVEDLKALIPVAQDVGIVLGDIAKIALPALGALKPAIELVDIPLRLLDDLLNQIPTPAASAAIAIFTLAKAIQVVRVLAALGAFDGIGAGLASLAARAAPAVVGIVAFEGTLAALNAIFPTTHLNVETLTKQIEALGREGNSQAALGQLGVSVRQLSKDIGQGDDSLLRRVTDVGKILTGGFLGNGFKDVQNIKQANIDIKATNDALGNLVNEGHVEEARHAFGRLSAALIENGTSAKDIGKAFQPFLDLAAAVEFEAKAEAEAVAKAGVTASASAGGWQQLAAAVAAGTVTSADAAGAAKDLGVSQAAAKGFIEDYAKSIETAKDKTLLYSPAANELRIALASGALSAGDAEAAFLSMGISLPGAQQAVADVTSEVKNFVDTVVGTLPTAQASIDSFSQGIKTAFGDVVTAQKSGSTQVESARKAVTSAQTALDRAQASAGAASARSTENAQRALDAAQGRVDRLKATGTASASAIANAEASVATAQGKLNDTVSGSGSSGALAVKNAQENLATANKALRESQDTATKDVAEATDKLKHALDTQTFIDDINAQAKAIVDFRKNLGTLVSEGFGQLAGELAKKGPEAGGALAASLAGDKPKAKAAEAGVELLTKAKQGMETFAREHASELDAVGLQVGLSVSGGLSKGLDFSNVTDRQVKMAISLVDASGVGFTEVAHSLAVGTVLGFEQAFGRMPSITEIKTGEAKKKLDEALGPHKDAAATLGSGASGSYAGGLDLSGTTKTAIDEAQGVFSPDKHVAFLAEGRALGHAVGVQFVLGVEKALEDPKNNTDIFNAADALAASMVKGFKHGAKIKSPSLAGIELGQLFGQGVAIGLGDSRPVESAARALASSIPAAFGSPGIGAPRLAGGLATAAVPAAVGGRTVDIKQEFHNVDVEPRHLAAELGWRLGG